MLHPKPTKRPPSRAARADQPRSGMVPAGPVIEHVAALLTAGYTVLDLSRMTGVQSRAIHYMISGEERRGYGGHRVYRRNADPLLAIEIPSVPTVRGLGTVRRLRALAAIGYGPVELDNGLPADAGTAHRITTDAPLIVPAEIADRAAAFYAAMQSIPGPNHRARCAARVEGWAAPLAWAVDDDDIAAGIGDIDDPAAVPGGRPSTRRGVPPDFVDAVLEHRELHRAFDEEIAEAMGLTGEAFSQRLHRAGLPQRRRGTGNPQHEKRVAYGARYTVALPRPVARAWAS